MSTTAQTTWELSEFTTHQKRLDQVSSTVTQIVLKSHEARDDNGDAYGVIFGWIVSPALNRVCDKADEFSSQLQKAVTASSTAIKASRDAYENAEFTNADRSQVVQAAMLTAVQTVRG